jgi:hypothetical protein
LKIISYEFDSTEEMNERSSNVYVKICISFQSDLADRYYWVRPEGTTVGKLASFGSSLKCILHHYRRTKAAAPTGPQLEKTN